jgi:predicted CoA-binding protein
MTTNDPDVIRDLLTNAHRWAVVGLSTNRRRVAYSIASYLQNALNKEIVAVHPKAEEVLGAPG